jgi:hypothetical protein
MFCNLKIKIVKIVVLFTMVIIHITLAFALASVKVPASAARVLHVTCLLAYVADRCTSYNITVGTMVLMHATAANA